MILEPAPDCRFCPRLAAFRDENKLKFPVSRLSRVYKPVKLGGADELMGKRVPKGNQPNCTEKINCKTMPTQNRGRE